jgi:hypothetical protein
MMIIYTSVRGKFTISVSHVFTRVWTYKHDYNYYFTRAGPPITWRVVYSCGSVSRGEREQHRYQLWLIPTTVRARVYTHSHMQQCEYVYKLFNQMINWLKTTLYRGIFCIRTDGLLIFLIDIQFCDNDFLRWDRVVSLLRVYVRRTVIVRFLGQTITGWADPTTNRSRLSLQTCPPRWRTVTRSEFKS